MINAVTICMRKYVTFSGRATRSEFWYFFLFLGLVHVVLIIFNSVLYGPEITARYRLDEQGQPTGQPILTYRYSGGVFGNVFFFATLLPWLAVGWRRMHDSGRAGYLPWLVVFAAAGAIAGLIAIVQPEGPAGVVLIIFTLIGTVLLNLYWLTRPSDPVSNRYGSIPLEVIT